MRRKQLGDHLQRLRKQADVSVEAAADVLGCSPGKVRHVENGRNALRKPELTVLLDLYGATDEVREVLEEIRREASKQGWWSTYKLPPWFGAFVGMEAVATRERTFELELIPGLLQTEEYARQVHYLFAPTADPGEIERKVAVRMRRQQRLFDTEALLDLHVVVSESALHRLAHTDVAAAQLRHLVAMAGRSNITVQVLPITTGLHVSMAGGFAVLGFKPEVSLPVGYTEYAVGGHLVDDEDVVTQLSMLFDHLGAQALDEEESLKLISGMIN